MAITPAYRYRARIVRIVDGDTFHVTIDLGYRVSITLPIRLHGVNAPEMSTVEGKAAREWLVARLAGHEDVILESFHDRQSFARWVADVWLDDGTALADDLVAAGHAVVFMA